jgi:hypothetical protein
MGRTYRRHGSGGNLSFRDSTYSPSFGSSLWESAPVLPALCDPTVGVLLREDWQNYDATATTGDYVLTQATTGAAAISTARPGVLELDSNSTTSTQGATLQRAKSAFVPVAGSEIWAEFQFKVVDTFDKVELFVGLSELDTTLIASSLNSSANHIGWECVSDDGVLVFAGEKAEDTWITVGFYVNGVTSIQQYVNGVATGTALATANVPIVALYPSFVCQSAGTNDPILHLRPYRVFQTIGPRA